MSELGVIMNKFVAEINKTALYTIDSMVFSEDKDPERNVPEVVSIGWQNVLSDPELNSSKTTLKELQYLEKITKSRTKKQEELVKIVDNDVADLFLPYLRKHDLKFPKKLIDSLWSKIIKPVTMNLKWQYNRARPYQLAPKRGIEIDYMETSTHHTPAYPSGHTAYATLLASVLSELYSEHSSKFYELVNQTGKARELQGVHYPSDNNASMVFVSAIWEDIKYDIL
tara:strand:- start:1004 stop:1681 length:678 start_codon:yes stop_codon:yes gene_type:complete